MPSNAAVLLTAVALGILLPPLTIHAQSTGLEQFLGRDLWEKPPSSGLNRLDEIVGEVPRGLVQPPSPWHVWKLEDSGQARYVVLLGEQELAIPGGSSACIELLDAAAKRIGAWSFQTGWRGRLVDASIEYSNDLGSYLIVIHTEPVINGRPIAREYFAISDDRLRFVRLEDSTGKIIQNEYVYPNFEIGVVPSAATVAQWVALLRSSDKADVLSALVFLGGRQLAEARRRFGPEPQESQYAKLFQQLIGDATIREVIENLRKSDNEWIKQAADLASREPRDRPLY